MSVCLSVRFFGETWFSRPLYKIEISLCMHIPLLYEYLFYKYFFRRSVGQATKGKRASLLMDVVILVCLELERKNNLITCNNKKWNFNFKYFVFKHFIYQKVQNLKNYIIIDSKMKIKSRYMSRNKRLMSIIFKLKPFIIKLFPF